MKNMMKKMMTLVLAAALAAMTIVPAFAEEAEEVFAGEMEIVEVEESFEEEIVEEEILEEETFEEIFEDEIVEEETFEETEEIVEEEIAEEETVEEIEEAEAAEAPTEEEIVEEVEETEEIIEEAAEEEFSAELEIMIAGEADELFYGDAVTLEAVVFGANMEYVVRWEAAGEDGEWFAVAEGSNVYEFVLTEETAAMQYRAVLVAVEL